MKWVRIAITIFSKLGGATCKKLSNGFTNLPDSILPFVFWVISFSIFIIVLNYFDLSFIYAIWAGIGILLVSVIGMTFFKEPVNSLKIISILIIVISVVMLYLRETFSKQ